MILVLCCKYGSAEHAAWCKGDQVTLPTAALTALLPLKPVIQISQQQWRLFTFNLPLSALAKYPIFLPCYNQ